MSDPQCLEAFRIADGAFALRLDDVAAIVEQCADLAVAAVDRAVAGGLGLGHPQLIYTNWAVYAVFCYLWLPYMIIPVYGALDRVPSSMIEASQDLGGRTLRTTWSVLLPLVLPGIVSALLLTFMVSFAAAMALVPIVIMGLYLWGAKALGAFEAL